MHRHSLSLLILITAALPQNPAQAQGALTNGLHHSGVIQVGSLDTWTFQANTNDSIIVSIGEVAQTPNPEFRPWIRLKSPDGAELGSNWSATAAQIDVRATKNGTYTVLVANNQSCGPSDSCTGSFPAQVAAGGYRLTLAKTPGPYSVAEGEGGGPITDTTAHGGTIQVGNVDSWTFHAATGDSVAISIGEVAADGSDPAFRPWIRLRGPDGAPLGSDWRASAAQIAAKAPLTGTYSVFVASNPACGPSDFCTGYFPFQEGPGKYLLTVSGFSAQTPDEVVVVTSAYAPGSFGAFFVTDVQVVNPTTAPITITPLFQNQAAGGAVSTGSAFQVPARSTRNFSNVLQSVFNVAPPAYGPIRFQGSASLIVSANVYTANACGTVGISYQGLNSSLARTTGLLPGMASDDNHRTNLVFYNPGVGTASITLDYGSGILQGLSLPPNGWTQLNGIGKDRGVTSASYYLIFTSSQPLLALGTVLDNTSNQSVAVPVASY